MRLHRAGPPPELDDETLARLLGEETTRILQAARESAAAIRSKAEEAAERMLREAREDAQHLREDAESEASRRRRDAEQDAEAELEMAKQQGREMVEEARAYRERVLSELSRRRDLARQQIDQLVHGRDRLVQAFERARLVAADVVAELAPLGELTEYVNLSPTTGPVPVMVPASRLGEISSISDDVLAAAGVERPRRSGARSQRLVRRDRGDRRPPRQRAPETAATDEAPTGRRRRWPTSDAERGRSHTPSPGPRCCSSPTGGPTPSSSPPGRRPRTKLEAEPESDDEVDDDAGRSRRSTSTGAEDDEVDDDDITANDVDNLFARLRSDGDEDASDAPDAAVDDASVGEPATPTPFERARRGVDAADREQRPQAQASARRRAERRARPAARQAGRALDRRRPPCRRRAGHPLLRRALGRPAGRGRRRRRRRSAPPTRLQPTHDDGAIGADPRRRSAAISSSRCATALARASRPSTATTRISPRRRGRSIASGRRSASTTSSTTCCATPTAAARSPRSPTGSRSAGCSIPPSAPARTARTTRCKAPSRPAPPSPPATSAPRPTPVVAASIRRRRLNHASR